MNLRTLLSFAGSFLKTLWQIACLVVICLLILTELPAPLGIGLIVALFVEAVSRAGKGA